ncbi:RadC family protein [Roseicella sp. DB1501]|uniref:RadC family protein n=1 Tax=Roseicella sp. DB1501 TaxID=2730925 RepID=UPI0020C440AF|nr:DNA repair protein RadC [Roseicella sp. DB1501]
MPKADPGPTGNAVPQAEAGAPPHAGHDEAMPGEGGFAEAGLALPLSLPLPLPSGPAASGPRGNGLRRRGAGPSLPGLTPAAEAAPPGHLGHRARMRQRLLQAGPEAVLDHELLEMVLFLALPRRDTKPLARALLARFGSFADAVAAPPAELRAVEGLGEAGMAALKTVQAAALRLARGALRQGVLLDRWDRLIDYLTIQLARERVEQLHVLYLDARNHLIADEVAGRGTVNHTPVYPRELVRRALELQATALILVHNHPSGDPTPSRADIEMTAEVKAAAALLGLVLHDHVIIGNGRHVSLRQAGLL